MVAGGGPERWVCLCAAAVEGVEKVVRALPGRTPAAARVSRRRCRLFFVGVVGGGRSTGR